MFDPSGIPVDLGGRRIFLTRERKIVEVLHYHVWGSDSGWELLRE